MLRLHANSNAKDGDLGINEQTSIRISE